MSNPVQSVDQEPVFGGARGVKRPLQGSNPTRVPRNQPAFPLACRTSPTRVRAPRSRRRTGATSPGSVGHPLQPARIRGMRCAA